MQLKTRLLKLERATKKIVSVCIIMKLDNELTPEQQKQHIQAKAEKRHIIMVSFVDPAKV